MGCHTWFCRPITEEERQQLRSTSKESIKRLLTITDDKWLYDKLIQSIENDTDFWIENNWYLSNDFIEKIEGKLYLDLSCRYPYPGDKYLLNVKEYFHDNFRVKNYPNWIIHSRKELRKKMKKKYFQLTEKQLEDVSRFFREYPGGVIHFG